MGGGLLNLEPVLIIGAGGHGRVIADLVCRQGRRLIGFLDDRVTGTINGYPVLGTVDSVHAILVSLSYRDVGVVLGVGDNAARQKLARRLESQADQGKMRFATVIDPSAVVSPYARIGRGSVVMPNAVVNSGARIGSHVIINTAAVVEHDAYIDDFAHLSPGVTLAGNVRVEQGAHVGAGAVAVPGRRIGAWSVVGAGSTVVRDIPDGVIAYGVPAIVRRQLN